MTNLIRRSYLLALVLLPSFACQAGEDEGEEEVGESSESSESGTASDTTSDTTSADTDSETTGDGDNACASAADCALVNDCCNCAAVPVGEQPSCEDMTCLQPSCEAQFGGFVPEATCTFGTCQLSALSCDIGQVTCKIAPPPACEGGSVRSVIDDCYGPCVPAEMCEELPFDCDATTCGDGFACLTSQSGSTSKCVPLPDDCGGVASCECVGPWIGEACNGACDDSGGVFLCQDGG